MPPSPTGADGSPPDSSGSGDSGSQGANVADQAMLDKISRIATRIAIRMYQAYLDDCRKARVQALRDSVCAACSLGTSGDGSNCLSCGGLGIDDDDQGALTPILDDGSSLSQSSDGYGMPDDDSSRGRSYDSSRHRSRSSSRGHSSDDSDNDSHRGRAHRHGSKKVAIVQFK